MVHTKFGNINRKLKSKVNRMTNGLIQQVPASCFIVPMMILKGPSQGPEPIRKLIHIKYMQIATQYCYRQG